MMNNYERIKNMTIDEMAEKISLLKSCINTVCDDDCPIRTLCILSPFPIDIIKWLLQEVEE